MLRDEVEVNDYHLAALMQYLGYACLSCKTSGTETIWVFRIPELDIQIVKDEFASTETTILLRGFIKALAEVASFRNFARRSLDGQWRSSRYSEPTVRRT